MMPRNCCSTMELAWDRCYEHSVECRRAKRPNHHLDGAHVVNVIYQARQFHFQPQNKTKRPASQLKTPPPSLFNTGLAKLHLKQSGRQHALCFSTSAPIFKKSKWSAARFIIINYGWGLISKPPIPEIESEHLVGLQPSFEEEPVVSSQSFCCKGWGARYDSLPTHSLEPSIAATGAPFN